MPRLLSRRALGVTILIVWAGVIGMHVRREYFRPRAQQLAIGARSLAPGSYYYIVRMNGQAIGFARSQFDTVATGYVFEDNILLDVPAMDTTHRAVAQTRIEFGSALQLNRFTFGLSSELGRFVVVGTARPDSALEIELRAGGDVQRTTIPGGAALVLDAAVPMRLAAAGELAVGRSVSTRVFDPSVMSERDVELSVTARDTMLVPDSAYWDGAAGEFVISSYDTIPVWRLEQRLGTVTVGNWIDEDGHLVKAESPLGFTLERTAYELADQEWKRAALRREYVRGYGAIIERTAIASNAELGASGTRAQLRVRLRGVELAGFDLSGGRQQLSGDVLTIKREAADALRANYQLPYTGTAEIAAELAETPLIQARDARIVRTARAIVGNTRDPGRAARMLNDWVYDNVEKNITLSVPSALQVLEGMQGDCNEHTVLYVALARSLGLPTRTAVGLVHLNGRFYYHAWPEVYLNGWVAVDPTLGQFPADATHLRFLVGGLARQVELIRLIGRLQLDIL